MKIQAALGGWHNAGKYTLKDSPNVYSEPGYSILFPLQYTVPIADTVYFLLRVRANNAGTAFVQSLSPSAYTVLVTEETTGAVVNATLTTNSLLVTWNIISPAPSPFSPLVLAIPIDFSAPNNAFRDRLLKIHITEKSSQECLVFRALVTDSSRPFSSITTYRGDEDHRQTVSVQSSSLILTATQKGSYTLLSPLNSLTEVGSQNLADFSYPQDRIYYARDKSVNLEEYQFSIENPSHPCIPQVVTIDRIPGYPGVAVLNITGYARKSLALLTGQPTFEVHAKSTNGLSANVDVLKVYLNRKPTLCAFDG